MENKDKQYELTINSAINILKVYTFIMLVATLMFLVLNYSIKLNRIWNMCFLIPIYCTYIASALQLILCFWRVGKVNEYNIDNVSNRKSNLIFSASITYLVFIFSCIMYILLSLILFIS